MIVCSDINKSLRCKKRPSFQSPMGEARYYGGMGWHKGKGLHGAIKVGMEPLLGGRHGADPRPPIGVVILFLYAGYVLRAVLCAVAEVDRPLDYIRIVGYY